MFLLRPSAISNQTFTFILAVVAQRYGVQVHCCCVMSNHLHLGVTDVRGNSPAFMRDLCALVARSFNSLHGRWEHFWAPGSYSAVVLSTPSDAIDKLAYILANPAAAHLVRRGEDWPGVWTAPSDIGGAPRPVERPQHFFRRKGPLPEIAALQLVPPPGFDSVEDFRALLLAKVKVLEDESEWQRRREGRDCLGVRRVLAQRPDARPPTSEPRRGLNPRIAARDKWRRMEAIGRLREFLQAYRQAWAAFVNGVRNTVFPAGTYWMHVVYGVTCAAAT